MCDTQPICILGKSSALILTGYEIKNLGNKKFCDHFFSFLLRPRRPHLRTACETCNTFLAFNGKRLLRICTDSLNSSFNSFGGTLVCKEGGRGFDSRDQTNTRGLKIGEEEGIALPSNL